MGPLKPMMLASACSGQATGRAGSPSAVTSLALFLTSISPAGGGCRAGSCPHFPGPRGYCSWRVQAKGKEVEDEEKCRSRPRAQGWPPVGELHPPSRPLQDCLGTWLELLQPPPSPPPSEGLHVAFQDGFTAAPAPSPRGTPQDSTVLVKTVVPGRQIGEGGH